MHKACVMQPEYKRINTAIAKLMEWPPYGNDIDDIVYKAEDLLLVLMKLKTKGWDWKIYVNRSHPDTLSVKISKEGTKFKHYSYSTKPTFALYGAIASILIPQTTKV